MSKFRKAKRRVNRIMKSYNIGDYVLSCNGHPSVVTEKWAGKSISNTSNYLFEGEYETQSLVDGRKDCCSFFNCPLVRQNKNKMLMMAEDFKKRENKELSDYEFNVKWYGQVWADEVEKQIKDAASIQLNNR